MQFHQAFYKKHGLKITEQPVDLQKSAEQVKTERRLHDASKNEIVTRQTVYLIQQAIEKYPDSAALKNYLYAAYVKTEQKEQALKTLYHTCELHPDYPFAIVNLVNHYIFQKRLELAQALLPEPYDVQPFDKSEYIHSSIFQAYYQTVVRLELAKGDARKAEQYHRLLFEYDPTDKVFLSLTNDIIAARVGGNIQ